MKNRIFTVFIGFCVLWALLFLRAANLQLVPNQRLQELESKKFKSVITLQSRRGAIVDRNGRDLAVSTTAYSLYADPKLIQQKRKVARRLAPLLGVSISSLTAKIHDSQRRFVWIERFIDEKKMQKIKALNIRGLAFVEEWKRIYPNESLLAHTLGFLGREGQGLEGLEFEKNHVLDGEKKKISVRRDARGRPLRVDGLLFGENAEGSEMKLTIDSELQYQLETELDSAVRNYAAESAVGIILEAKTSAIRAMAVGPSFNLNTALNVPAEIRRNRVITDTFEPGSTMKTFLMATALSEKVAQPNSKYFCENGSWRLTDRVIKEADTVHKFGWLTMTEILSFSSNIGTSKIALDLGSEKVREALLNFGFGQKTGIELPGEGKGLLQTLPWNPHLLANVSFGHGISASPLQIANAYAAVVNGGFLNKPYLIDEIRPVDTKEVVKTRPELIRQVLSAENSEKLRLMLVAATAPGATGEKARVPGFLVGGKTGTAQKVNPNGRGYLPGVYISSFAGFIPAHDPKYVIYIAVDQPQKAYYGSQVAAPIFSRLAAFAARKEGWAPILLTDLEKKQLQEFKKSVGNVNIAESMEGRANISAAVVPEDFGAQIPDLKNLTLREVLSRMRGQDVKLEISGSSGSVVETIPSAGGSWNEERRLRVILK